ncbi:Hachiman antiphage defense system protein HamA [Duganella sp. BuS-21]|uniref:Hachiman antiphage defense system protein HamA n=1 Tax=Duganella sp. BuS-21 TaxID=2943848 RepID=UPI0035A688E4
MSKFMEWCTPEEVVVSAHSVNVLRADPTKRPQAVKILAEVLPDYYAEPQRISALLDRLGRQAVAKYVQDKLPTSTQIRSGDLGEILCNAYVLEGTVFKLGIKRLRYKDHRNMSMRGEDVLAFNLNGPSRILNVLKAEVKSRAAMTTTVIQEARSALDSNADLPSAHAIAFVADRLTAVEDLELRDAIDDAMLKDGLKASQVTHMLFTFSGNNPTKLLTANLTGYAGMTKQSYVGLQVDLHQIFVKDVFEAVEK